MINNFYADATPTQAYREDEECMCNMRRVEGKNSYKVFISDSVDEAKTPTS
jgi:hypothetical protein